MTDFHAMAIAMAKGLFKVEKLEEPQKLYSVVYQGKNELCGYYGEYASIAEALSDVSDHANDLDLDMEGEVLEISECRRIPAEIDVDCILEQIKSDLYQRCENFGTEYDDDFLDHVPLVERKELQTRLNTVFNTWLREHSYHPNSYEYLPVGEFKCIDGKWRELEY